MADTVNTVCHRRIRQWAQHHSVQLAIDATCGRGNDTLFLASLAQQVIAMDIQEEAIIQTRRRLGDLAHVQLYCHDHAHLDQLVSEPADLIVFNLGYLPRSQSPLITTAATTLPALDAALRVLKPQGLLSLACYRGHPGGQEEWEAVQRWIIRHADRFFCYQYSDGRSDAPVLLQLSEEPFTL